MNISVYLNNETVKKLKKHSKRTGHSVSRIIENAVLQWFGEKTKSSILLRLSSIKDQIENMQTKSIISIEMSYLILNVIYKHLIKDSKRLDNILVILTDRIINDNLLMSKIEKTFEKLPEIESEIESP